MNGAHVRASSDILEDLVSARLESLFEVFARDALIGSRVCLALSAKTLHDESFRNIFVRLGKALGQNLDGRSYPDF